MKWQIETISCVSSTFKIARASSEANRITFIHTKEHYKILSKKCWTGKNGNYLDIKIS